MEKQQRIKALIDGGNRRTMSVQKKEELKNLCISGADAGDAYCCLALGRLYYEGFCVDQDYGKARDWFTKAYKSDLPWAAVYLGYCSYYGRDIPVDYKAAFDYFTEAAKAKNACALYKLGDMYKKGFYVEKDPSKAAKYYYAAYANATPAEAEFPNICFRIGDAILRGMGCIPDPMEALMWLHQAQEGCYRLLLSGNPYAHLSLPEIEGDIDAVIAHLKAETQGEAKVQY
jgi:TPR repeat protein